MSNTIESISREERTFPPPPAFAARAHVSSQATYEAVHKRSIEEPDALLARGRGCLPWFRAPTIGLEWDAPHAKWFSDGITNLAWNCLDRHVNEGRGNKAAIIWESEPGETRTLTYAQLLRETQRLADRPRSPRRAARRSRRHLYGHGPRGRDRDARMRADRRDPHGDLRRVRR